MRSRLATAVMALCISSPALAADNVGEFIEKGGGTWMTVDGEFKYVTTAPITYIDPNGLDWPVPTDFPSDGASIPWPFWPVIGHPFGGEYVWAAFVHDFYCERQVRTEEATHRTFYYAARSMGVEDWKADLMYWAVATFGPHWTLQTDKQPVRTCRVSFGHQICDLSWETPAAPPQMIDFNDDILRAAALSKFVAVARTLKTTGGAAFDVTADGPVTTSIDNIEASAAAYRELFLTRQVLTQPEALGLLDDYRAGTTLETLRSWPNGEVPEFNAVARWSPTLSGSLDGGFVLDQTQLTEWTVDSALMEAQRLNEIMKNPTPNELVLMQKIQELQQFQLPASGQ